MTQKYMLILYLKLDRFSDFIYWLFKNLDIFVMEEKRFEKLG